MWIRLVLMATVSILMVLGVRPAGVAAENVTITGTVTQLTTLGIKQSDPDISGNLVVYEEFSTEHDVRYIDLNILGSDVLITGPGDQRLSDVSAPFIVYTNEEPPISGIIAHDVGTGLDVDLTDTGLIAQRNPGIDGTIVAFEQTGLFSFTRIATADVLTKVVSLITPGIVAESAPAVSGNLVAFQRNLGLGEVGFPGTKIVIVDTSTGAETIIGIGRNPDIDGNRVVYSREDTPGDRDIHVFDIDTAVDISLPLVGGQFIPHVSGDFVSFDDHSRVSPSDPDIDVVLYHIPSGVTHRIGDIGVRDHLNDLDGNRVVYASDKAGNDDIWMFTFTVFAPLEQIADVLTFIDDSVANGTLEGNGPGNSGQNRLNALRNMIMAAGDLIEEGSTAAACQQLLDAFKKTDGLSPPPDFVSGPAASELASRIQDLRNSLGCL